LFLTVVLLKIKLNMKTICKSFALLLVPALLFTACGGDAKKEEGKKEKPEKKIDPELKKHIDELAACEQQNTNCEAYNKTSEFLKKQCEDEKKCETMIADLFTIIEKGPSKHSQAAAHAVNFWTYGKYKENPEYGRIVLNTLLKEKFEEGNYTGGQLGQLLSKWFLTEDKKLFADILKAVKSKDTERYGRTELIRLVPPESLGNPELFKVFTDIINDADEAKEVRVQCLNVIWRAEDENSKATVRSVYEGLLSNPDVQIAGTAMLGLGYMKSVASYDLVEKMLTDNKDNQEWCYYGSYCLSEMVRDNADNVDAAKVFNLVKTLISNKTVSAYYRSYYVSTLISLNTPAAKTLLNQLKASGEKEIKDEVINRMK
jgi:hypothetical protein